jgi:hypothetical protein
MSFWDLAGAAHLVSPYLVAFLTALVTVGFARLLLFARGIVRLLTLGFLLLYFQVMARTVYWDLLPRWMPEAAWAAWSEMTNGPVFNVVFHFWVVVASWYSLRAIHRSIPEPDRQHYNLLTAVRYPRGGNPRRGRRRG